MKCCLEITGQLAFFPLKIWSILLSPDTENGGTQTIANFHDNEIDSLGSVSMGSRLFSKHGILGSECATFVQASLWHMLSCSPAFSEVKFYSLREARCSAWFANQSPCNFVRIEGMTKRKRHTDNACFLADSAFLNNAARSDFCCLETAFLRGRNVSLETGFGGFNHKRKDRVS